MFKYIELSTEKYYADKVKAEFKDYRRQHAKQSIKSMLTMIVLVGLASSVAATILFVPDFVPNCVDWLKTSGFRSF